MTFVVTPEDIFVHSVYIPGKGYVSFNMAGNGLNKILLWFSTSIGNFFQASYPYNCKMRHSHLKNVVIQIDYAIDISVPAFWK